MQVLPGIDDVAEVWRQRSVVGDSGGLGVRVWLGEIVGQLPGPGEHLTALIGTVHNFNLCTTQDKPLVTKGRSAVSERLSKALVIHQYKSINQLCGSMLYALLSDLFAVPL